MELWDIYDKNKVRTGRTMERNHFNLADDEYHLTVLGVIARPDGQMILQHVWNSIAVEKERNIPGDGDRWNLCIWKCMIQSQRQ